MKIAVAKNDNDLRRQGKIEDIKPLLWQIPLFAGAIYAGVKAYQELAKETAK